MMNEMSAWKWDGRNLWSMMLQRKWYLWSYWQYKSWPSQMASCKDLNEDMQSYLVQLKIGQHFYIPLNYRLFHYVNVSFCSSIPINKYCVILLSVSFSLVISNFSQPWCSKFLALFLVTRKRQSNKHLKGKLHWNWHFYQ